MRGPAAPIRPRVRVRTRQSSAAPRTAAVPARQRRPDRRLGCYGSVGRIPSMTALVARAYRRSRDLSDVPSQPAVSWSASPWQAAKST
jgi:hypothetical protein